MEDVSDGPPIQRWGIYGREKQIRILGTLVLAMARGLAAHALETMNAQLRESTNAMGVAASFVGNMAIREATGKFKM